LFTSSGTGKTNGKLQRREVEEADLLEVLLAKGGYVWWWAAALGTAQMGFRVTTSKLPLNGYFGRKRVVGELRARNTCVTMGEHVCR